MLQQPFLVGSRKTRGADVKDRFDQARRKSPVRARTGQAALSPSAKPEKSPQIQRRGRALSPCTSAAQAAAPWREKTAEALRRDLLSPSTDGLR